MGGEPPWFLWFSFDAFVDFVLNGSMEKLEDAHCVDVVLGRELALVYFIFNRDSFLPIVASHDYMVEKNNFVKR